MKLTNQIYNIMYKKKLNHVQLAQSLKASGFTISPSNLTRYTKSNNMKFSIEMLQSLCNAFQCTPNEIFLADTKIESTPKKSMETALEIDKPTIETNTESKTMIFNLSSGPTFTIFPKIE